MLANSAGTMGAMKSGNLGDETIGSGNGLRPACGDHDKRGKPDEDAFSHPEKFTSPRGLSAGSGQAKLPEKPPRHVGDD